MSGLAGFGVQEFRGVGGQAPMSLCDTFVRWLSFGSSSSSFSIVILVLIVICLMVFILFEILNPKPSILNAGFIDVLAASEAGVLLSPSGFAVFRRGEARVLGCRVLGPSLGVRISIYSGTDLGFLFV